MATDPQSGKPKPHFVKRKPPSSGELLERQPPCDANAELAVLGSILILPDVIDEVAMILRPSDFHADANQRLYTQLVEMHDGGTKIDITLLSDRLRASGDFELIGGARFLASVINSVPHAAHATYYAKIVREKATLRALISASTQILRDAYDETLDAKEVVGQAEQSILDIQDTRGNTEVPSISSILHLSMDRLEARMRGEQTVGSVDTGFDDYDALTGGLHNAELSILAARPSMGKTAFAMNIAENVAIGGGHPVLFVSLEMSAIEVVDRMLCSVARVNGHRLRNGTLSNEDQTRLVEKAGEISTAPLFIDDSPSRTVSEIAAAARRIRRREGRLSLIVIDYLQLIEPDNSRDPRQEQVARIARRLKGLAREMDVPMLCLSQLNRQAEDSRDHRPKLSHLRESGAIEQDADVVMFVHREEYYHRGEEAQQYAGQAEIIIAKQRNGPVDTVELVWKRDFTRFENRAPDRLQEFDDFNSQPF
ncbi:MAG: replicative DNA helicase [Planctomycetales bacterium]|nr:replicative DNA helicase [Planctomycetales bacterium]